MWLLLLVLLHDWDSSSLLDHCHHHENMPELWGTWRYMEETESELS